MMASKQLLHELLEKDQEPFQLSTYIQHRQSQFKKPYPATAAVQLTKRSNNLCRHACFFAFQNSPFRDFPLSPMKSPCKSRSGAVFLHIPSKTAALLAEAAMRIQKQQHSKPKSPNLRFGMLGSFFKSLKVRGKSKKRSISNGDFVRNEIMKIGGAEETARVSSSCSHRRPGSADSTETCEDNKSLGFEASTSNYGSDESITADFDFLETRFSSSPFRFSLHKSPSSNGRRTPDFSSPLVSPSRQKESESESSESHNSDKIQGEEEEQCSPVSVLDRPFEDDDEHGSADHDFNLECSSYANVQKAKEKLLSRLRRFEKLAELDPLEMERMILEGSDDDSDELGERHDSIDTFVTQVFNNSMTITTDTKKLVVEGDGELDSWKEAEFKMMIGLDLNAEQVDGTAAEIEVAILEMLVEEAVVLLCRCILC